MCIAQLNARGILLEYYTVFWGLLKGSLLNVQNMRRAASTEHIQSDSRYKITAE